MDIRKVKKLIELLEESGIAEIEITEGDDSVRISRHGAAPQHYAPPPPPPAAAPLPVAAPAEAPAAAPVAEVAAGHTVTAPMVGTFYAASSPGDAPFAAVGNTVEVGDTLCIIEAMKMMNQIESDRAGRITAVLASNGEPIEYGQPLFVIED